MAANLKAFCSKLRELKWVCDGITFPGEFQVLALFSYIADSTFLKSVTPAVINYSRTTFILHDIIITDGKDKLKCFLPLCLGDLVQKNILKVGDSIQIKAAKLCYLEGEYGDQHLVTYVMLEDISVLEMARILFPDLAHLHFLESSNNRESELIPLVTNRKHYVHVWWPMFPYGPVWTNSSSITYNENDVPPGLFQKLKDFNNNDWRRLPKPYSPLLLRVLYRGKMYHFGSNLNNKSLPFAAFIIVADSTGFTTLVCFDKRNYGTYYNSSPGTVLLVELYSLQERTRDGPVPSEVGSLRNLLSLSVEVVVNYSSTVRIVPNDCSCFQQQISVLPSIEYKFVERASLISVAETTKIDIVGLITFVSRYERFPYKFNNLHCSYWIEAIDSSSHLPFRIALFAEAYRFNHDAIHPGKVLIATQLEVQRVADSIIPDKQAATYLKASVYSEFYIDHQGKPYQGQQAVHKLANAIKDQGEHMNFIRNNVLRIGGHYNFPPGPKDLESLKSSFDDGAGSPKMIPGALWRNNLHDLKYRERNVFTVGGFIVRAQYVDLQTIDSDEPAYGWSYSHDVVSVQTVFQSIKDIGKLRNSPLLNARHCSRFLFPHKFSTERKEELMLHRMFPPTTAENWSPSVEVAVQSIPILADGYYVITIVSLHYQNLMQCILIPEPSVAPHPTFLELLSGQYQSLPFRQSSSFIGEPPQYTLNELKKIKKTAGDVANKTFVFLLEAFCPKQDVYEVFIKRGYLCPPDQFNIVMETDQQL